ncbi:MULTISPECIES: hypothetical protein [unclassified Paenibacillus]|uniref:hypothetical protein n=1 Tax=unclassified Paenibacillus TaxID=185978 RepID=UPI00097A246F|nr:hypothetical protein BK140_03560 [Paenibacillus macerans]
MALGKNRLDEKVPQGELIRRQFNGCHGAYLAEKTGLRFLTVVSALICAKASIFPRKNGNKLSGNRYSRRLSVFAEIAALATVKIPPLLAATIQAPALALSFEPVGFHE